MIGWLSSDILSVYHSLCDWLVVLSSAEALQTIIQLRGEKDMYEAWKNHVKVEEVRWTEEKARSILNEWQRKFTDVSAVMSPFMEFQEFRKFEMFFQEIYHHSSC